MSGVAGADVGSVVVVGDITDPQRSAFSIVQCACTQTGLDRLRGVMTFGATKGHARREVPMPRFMIEELAALVSKKNQSDLVFVAPWGGVMRSQGFQRSVLADASTAMELEGFTPHMLRHTAASLAIASGADVKVVQTMLGHKSAIMTLDLYGHLFRDQLDTVADAMESARMATLTKKKPTHEESENVEKADTSGYELLEK